MQAQHQSLYRSVTDKIVEAIRAGAQEFKMPWHSSDASTAMPINASTDAAYRGINVLSLWIEAQQKFYPTGYWASYRQWLSLGAQVRKGEHGATIVFYKTLENRDGQDNANRCPFVARGSRVFNVAQVDGWSPPNLVPEREFQTDKQAESFIAATRAQIHQGFSVARYRRDSDVIEIPSPGRFSGTSTSSPLQSYYAVLLHELTHWSGASHRLNRQFGKRFGDQAYAVEELVAELGAAFLCSLLGIANEPRPDHASYVGAWLQVLGKDSQAIFTAANRAQLAVEFLAHFAYEAGTIR